MAQERRLYFIYSVAGFLVLETERWLDGHRPDPVLDESLAMDDHPVFGEAERVGRIRPEAFCEDRRSRKNQTLHQVRVDLEEQD